MNDGWRAWSTRKASEPKIGDRDPTDSTKSWQLIACTLGCGLVWAGYLPDRDLYRDVDDMLDQARVLAHNIEHHHEEVEALIK